MNDTYPKIQTVFKRDPETNFKTLLLDQFSVPEFCYLQENLWEFTEKLDGTNVRVIFEPYSESIEFRGRTDRAQMPPNLLCALNGIFHNKVTRMLEKFPDGACLYGEGVGPGIQKGGGNYGETCTFVLFDVLIDGIWLKSEDVSEIAHTLNLRRAPVIGFGNLHLMQKIVMEGMQSRFGEFQAEGIVARPVLDLRDRMGRRIITKLKTKDFAKQ